MQSQSKKNRIAELILSLMDSNSYHRYELDRLIVESIRSRYLSEPMYAVDHLRRALVDYGYMEKDPKTDVYSIIDGVEKPQVKHCRIEQKLLSAIDNNPEIKVKCEFCENLAKPSATLNHYYKKHSQEAYLGLIKKEFGKAYLNH